MKNLIPHLVAIAILLLSSCLYFFENSVGGKAMPQYDNQQARGMQGEIMKYMEQDGQVPQWTNSTFGGMPTYQIYAKPKGNFTEPFSRIFYLGQKFESLWAYVFGAMFSMYLLLVMLRLDYRVAIFGALAFGLTTYNMDILHAGHSTKMSALAFAPGVLAGAALIFHGRFLLGGGVLALFTSMQVLANHFQITYYTMLIVGIYFLVDLVWSLRHQNALANWGLRVGTFMLAVSLGFASNLSRIWPTLEFGDETIRGRSELKQKESKGNGLSKDYVFGYKYGVGESLTLLVPHAAGGGANETITKGKFFNMLTQGSRNPAQVKQVGRQIAGVMYHGTSGGVGTAIYFGAIVCFLAFAALWLVRSREKWWLAAAGTFMVMIAWGDNIIFNEWLFEYFPLFNKFRAVSMALGLGQLCFAALAALGLQKFFDEDIAPKNKLQAIGVGVGATAFFSLLAMLFGGGAGPNDAEIAKQIQMSADELTDILSADRTAMARSDAFRSMGFILASAAVLFLYLKSKLKPSIAVMAVAMLALIDHWGISKRNLDNDLFQDKKTATAQPSPTTADKEILADPDPHYRVLDLTRGSFTGNGLTSFFHKSLSGYSAVKIQRYQEVIDSVFAKDNLMNLMNVLGMFNTKYIIAQGEQVIRNPKACGHAWFVQGIQIVGTAEEELAGLRKLNTRDTALVQQKFAEKLAGIQFQPDSTANIRLTKYHPDRMEYEYSTTTDKFAVFPEIFYPAEKGWQFYLNGQPYSSDNYLKVNYLMRGVRLPSGQNQKFEMRFEPRSYYLGETVSRIASLLVLLLFGWGLFVWYKKHGGLDAPQHLAEMPAPSPPPAAPREPAMPTKKRR